MAGLLISAIVSQAQEPAPTANELYAQARSHFRQRQDSAMYYALLSKSAAEKAGDSTAIARAHLMIGVIYKNIDQFSQAMEHQMKSLRISENLDDKAGQAKAHGNIGTLYSLLEMYPEALKSYQRCLEIRKQNPGDIGGLLRVYQNLSVAHTNLKQYPEARHYFQAQLQLAREDYFQQASIFQNLGTWFDRQGRIDSARFYFRKSLTWYKDLDELGGVDAMYNLGCLAMQDENYYHALRLYFLPALTKARMIGYEEIVDELFEQIAKAYQILGKTDLAVSYYEKWKQREDSLGTVAQKQHFNTLDVLYRVSEQSRLLAEQSLVQEQLHAENRQLLLTLIIAMLVIGSLLGAWLFNRRKRYLEARLSQERQDLLKEEMLGLIQQKEIQNMKVVMDRIDVERQRIAHELHSHLGNLLVTVRYNLKSLEPQLAHQATGASNPFETLDHYLTEAIKSVRKISHDMADGVMSQFGLVHKLRIMTEAVEQAGQLKVHFHHHGLDERLPEALEKQVLTILEELITNALKHAEGQNLEIQLVRNGIYLTISVEDDGKGFDMASLGKQTKAGLGLKSLEQIIKQLGGQLSIESQPGMGSSTFIEIPL